MRAFDPGALTVITEFQFVGASRNFAGVVYGKVLAVRFQRCVQALVNAEKEIIGDLAGERVARAQTMAAVGKAIVSSGKRHRVALSRGNDEVLLQNGSARNGSSV